MSALVALLRFDGQPVGAADLAPPLATFRRFGPQNAIWTPDLPGPVGLGCRAWPVTPEDQWYQPPVRSPNGDVVLIADARIDNREDLAARLGLTAAETAQWSDPAFILAAYLRWDTAGIEHLIGDFGFIIWDHRRRRLIAARDGLGQRVLFYHQTPRRLAIANSVAALLALPDVQPRLDQRKVADFLVLYQDPEHTFFEGIRRVRAGHTLIAADTGVTMEQFWSPRPRRPVVFGSDREYVEGFRAVFHQAVRSQIRGPAPIGVMLSGGLDSASVAAVAARELGTRGQRLLAFHAAPRAGFAAPDQRGWVADESADVEAIARLHHNLDLEVFRPTGATVFDDVERSFEMTGAPARNPSNVTWFDGIYAIAEQRGVRILLAGHAGNATISYGSLRAFRQWARHGQWGHLWREVRAHARLTKQPPFNVLRDQVLRPFRNRLRARATGWRTPAEAPVWESTYSPILPEFARQMEVTDRVRAARRNLRALDDASDLDVRLAILTGPADGPDVYCAFRDWFGIETRDPTADRRVVEYTLAIPDDQFFRDGLTRALVRRAMEGYLPDQVRLRRTRGSQGADWLEWFPSLRSECQHELDSLAQSETARRCLDLPRLGALVNRWPNAFTVDDESEYKFRLLRGLTMGRFIRWFEAKYQ